MQYVVLIYGHNTHINMHLIKNYQINMREKLKLKNGQTFKLV